MRTLVAASLLVLLVSCSRDPNVVKMKYLENGNKYFDRGRYKEASIMYRNALAKDALFGMAHYKLGLTNLKLGQIAPAVGSLRRAVECLKNESERKKKPLPPEYWDASINLAELFVTVGRDKQFIDEAEVIVNQVLEKDPGSYDGHRLTGDLAFRRAQVAYQAQDRPQGEKELEKAVAEYRKAEAIKPNQLNVLLALARALTASHDYPAAEGVYQSVIAKDPQRVLAYSELYQLYAAQKKTEQAEQVLYKCLENNPKQYGVMLLLATHYSVMGRQDDMAKMLRKLKASAKDYPDAYKKVGDFYLRLNQPDQAIKEYREGMAADPTHKLDYQKRVIEVLLRQGKKTEAADLNAALLKDRPKDGEARTLAASLMMEKGDLAKALSELQGVVNTSPDNFVARYQLGRAYMMRNELEQARQQFEKATQTRPDHLPARMALAQLHVMRGEYDGALKAVEDILKLDPRSGGAKLLKALALMGQKKYPESRAVLDGMLAANPSSPDVLYQVGVLNLAEHKYKEAEDSFRKASQQDPANVRGLMGVVETFLAQHQPDKALETLRTAIQQAPNRTELRVMFGNTAVRVGKYDAAIGEYQAVLQKVEAKSRAAAELRLKMGETMRRKGDMNGAVGELQKAREVMPDNAMVLTTLALTLEGAGRKPEAKTAYEQTLKIDQANGVALNNLAFLIAETGGDLDQALTYAQRSKQVLPDLLEVSDTLGWIYLKKNLSDSAIQVFSDLVNKAPNNSTFRYHLGMALSQKGDRPRAVKELERALESKPSREEENQIRLLLNKLR